MTTSEEQLQEWEALVPKLNDDADDHMDVAHSADMRPEHTANYRHAKNAHEAAYAIHSLIADLREAREQLASPYMDGYEAAKEEYRPQVIALEAKLAEAQALVEKFAPLFKGIGYVGADKEFAHDLQSIRKAAFGNRGSALTAAIDTVVAPHLQKLAELESKIEFQNNELAEKQKYILSLERNLWGAELRNAQILSVAEKMRCAGGAQEFQYWFDELKWFLLRKQDTSALDTAIDAATAAQEKP